MRFSDEELALIIQCHPTDKVALDLRDERDRSNMFREARDLYFGETVDLKKQVTERDEQIADLKHQLADEKSWATACTRRQNESVEKLAAAEARVAELERDKTESTQVLINTRFMAAESLERLRVERDAARAALMKLMTYAHGSACNCLFCQEAKAALAGVPAARD